MLIQNNVTKKAGHWSVMRVGGFVKSYVKEKGSPVKYLLFITRVGGWSEKGQKHPYVISHRGSL